MSKRCVCASGFPCFSIKFGVCVVAQHETCPLLSLAKKKKANNGKHTTHNPKHNTSSVPAQADGTTVLFTPENTHDDDDTHNPS